ncbi:sigma-70 family RNA polymerase sigma factor [Candidatus Saccharibacteria bacterium]|nr:sigma-70 family RNA polymerase sigma factor [Candidatus Saccharibacteria bacterium]
MQGLESFYDEYVEKVYKYFYIYCLNRHVAEDLTSHTFISFIDKVSENNVADRKKYLYAIMRNVWADHLRSKYKEAVESLESIEDFELHAVRTVEEFESKDTKERLRVYLERLPEKQRQIAEMRFLRDMSPNEIAAEIGKDKKYVKTTQYRAVKNLRAMVEQPELGGMLS